MRGLSTRQPLTPVEESQLSVQVVNNDFSTIESDRLWAIMERCSDVFGDVKFDVEAKHKTVHNIENPGNKFPLNQDRWLQKKCQKILWWNATAWFNMAI